MPNHLVAYDLRKAGQNYEGLIAKLETYPKHWHMQQSVWLIKSGSSAAQVRDELKTFIDANDKLFVATVTAAAWSGYADEINKWVTATLTSA